MAAAPTFVVAYYTHPGGSNASISNMSTDMPGVVDGDLLVAFPYAYSTVAVPLSTPSGWTRKVTSAGGIHMAFDYRIAASEGASSYTWTATGTPAGLQVAAYRGAVFSDEAGLDTGNTYGNDNAGNNDTTTKAERDNAVVVTACRIGASASVSTPAGTTRRSGDPSTGDGHALVDETQAARGNVTSRLFGFGGMVDYTTINVVLHPPGAGSQMML